MLATISRPVSRTNVTMIASLAAAGIIVVMLLAQLYGFEDFASILLLVSPTMPQSNASIMAAGVVIAELLALPYLLNMHMSVLFRFMSALASSGIAVYWLLTALTNSHASNIGMFSNTLVLAGGVVPFLIAGLIVVCVSFVVYADTKVTDQS